jgi:pyruvate carboxylase subunit B
MRYTAQVNDHSFSIEVTRGSGRLELAIDGQRVEADWEWLGRDRDISLILDGRSYDIKIEPENGRLHLYYGGERFDCSILDERIAELRRLAGDTGSTGILAEIKAPMPGLILKVFAEAGQEVAKGERLMIIEAMKMENELKAPRDGVIKAIQCTEQEAVEQGKVLVVLE